MNDSTFLTIHYNPKKDGFWAYKRLPRFIKGTRRLKSMVGEDLTVYGNVAEADFHADIDFFSQVIGRHRESKIRENQVSGRPYLRGTYLQKSYCYPKLQHSKLSLTARHARKNGDMAIWVDCGLMHKDRRRFNWPRFYWNLKNLIQTAPRDRMVFARAGWHRSWCDKRVYEICPHPGVNRLPAGGIYSLPSEIADSVEKEYFDTLDELLEAGCSPVDEDVWGVISARESGLIEIWPGFIDKPRLRP